MVAHLHCAVEIFLDRTLVASIVSLVKICGTFDGSLVS